MSHKKIRPLVSMIIVLVLTFGGITPVFAAPPANDNFNSAIDIGPLPFTTTQNTSEATVAGDDPVECHNNGSVWYAFTPAADMMVIADTIGSDYDTTLAVYTGTQGALTLVPEACNDDFHGLQSQVQFNATSGTTYYFLLGFCCGTGSNGGGNLVFSVYEEVPPANDHFAIAKAVASLPFSGTVEARFATTEADEPFWCYATQRTVWYSFTPTDTTAVQVDMQGSANDGSVNIYRLAGTSITDLSFMTCMLTNDSPYYFTAEAGQTYYFQTTTFQQNGTAQLNINEVPPPPNDKFLNAAEIPSLLPFDDNVNTIAASIEVDEPTTACGNPSRTAWYAFTPAATGMISARSNGNFGPMLAAYTGNSLTSLTLIGCRPYYFSQPLTFLAEAGTTYYFQVGDFFGDGGGSLQFHLEVTPPPVANFYVYPSDPSVFDNVTFCDQSDDPGGLGFLTVEWEFGDGSTATGFCTNHHYAADGDYTVEHSVTTIDGRSASTSQVVQVRTHDVSITKLSAPKTASVGQKKSITVSLKNTRYSENVTIQLYRSVDGSNFEWVASLTKPVPVRKGNRITSFNFNYTFSAQDAATGKVIFKAVVIIDGARDAFPIDNEAIAIPPTLVKGGVSYP